MASPDDGGKGGGKTPYQREALAAESSLQLLERAQAGDQQAIEVLIGRYLPRLRRWASGRLPRWARDLSDTDDLVQETVMRTLRNVEGFEPEHEGALQAYLRQAIINAIRNEVRRVRRRPAPVELSSDAREANPDDSPLEQAIGSQALQRYEAALGRLRAEDRNAIVARVEMGCSYEEVAASLGKPTADAARMAVKRALIALAEEMAREE
jgi:RNA polymerase sigma-70 factor (ECF subfamily)